ncbi:transketolase family protein [Clostridium sp. LBM24168]
MTVTVNIVKELCPEKMEMRNAFCNKLIELAAKNEKIVVMDADLMGAMGTKPFQKRFPERTIDCGIQEANMYGVAAGLSIVGKIPFAHTFGSFASRRAYDQIFISGAYANANVKVIGSDPGITAQINGGTHMPFEDMGLMRLIPTMTVVEPTDIIQLQQVIEQMADTYGMYYMRLVRKSCTKIFEESSKFEIGKASFIREGKDATIICSGFCVAESMKAAVKLNKEGISVRILNMFTWKPLDEEAIIKAAEDTGAIITAENHNIINGLGAAVSEVVVRNKIVPIEMIGVNDEFGQVGFIDYLSERYQLTANYIVEAVKRAVARK